MRTIDLKPTWTETANMLLAIIENGTDDSKDFARAEIRRMGQIIDHLKAQQKGADQ